jgi:hypothetical protein
MKPILSLLAVFVSLQVQAQTTTIRTQGSNTGYGGAYVAPVSTKTYTPKAASNTPYAPPAKNYNYTPPASGSGSRSSGSGGGSNSNAEVTTPRAFSYTEFLTPDDEACKAAIEKLDVIRFYEINDNPQSKFNSAARGGGRRNLGSTLMFTLADRCVKDYTYLPAIYYAYYVKKTELDMPIFYCTERIINITFSYPDFAITNACIYLGNYAEAIKNFRNHAYYGQKKLAVRKGDEFYDWNKNTRNYINYMAGRCFQELGMKDSARKYLRLGDDYEEMWDKLYAAGAVDREKKELYDPALATQPYERSKQQ